MSSIGKPVAHDSAREHVRGEAAYLVDLPPLRGELTVDFVGSPVAHGRIKSIDVGAARKVEGIVRDMMKEKGFQAADVTHEITEATGGPKLVNVVFTMSEGPKVKISRLDFTGNHAIPDASLQRRMKENKAHWLFSWITGRGTYQETKFEEDAERVVEYYRDRGYIRAQIGEPVTVTNTGARRLGHRDLVPIVTG